MHDVLMLSRRDMGNVARAGHVMCTATAAAQCCGRLKPCESHSDAFISAMIIPSQNPPMHKADQQQMSLPPPGGPSPPPPPYPSGPSHQSTAHYAVVDTFERPQECAKWRFIKAFLVAALIWFLTGAFVSSSLNSFGIIRPVCARF